MKSRILNFKNCFINACFLFSIVQVNAQGVNFEWAKNMGGMGVGYGNGVATDAVGNVYTVGYFDNTSDFDPGTGTSNMTSAGMQDIFVSKLDAAGNFVWAKQFGSGGGDQGFAIATDATGNVYFTGHFTGTVDFDPGTPIVNLVSSGGSDVCVVKLNASGNLVWARKLGGNGIDQSTSMTVDASGNVYTTGFFQNTADFDPGTATSNLVSAGGFDVFISKLNNAGDFVWAKQLGGSSSDFGNSIAVDASGNVYTCGFFMSTADFDPGPGLNNINSAGNYDVFISKLDAAGAFVWAKGIGGPDFDQGYSVAADGTGNVYTTGYFTNTVDFDPGSGTSNLVSAAGSSDIFLSKLNAGGDFVWAKKMGGSGSDYGNALTLDAAGNPCIMGYFNNTVDFDPGPGTADLVSAGADDIFVTKISAAGNLLWAKRLGGFSNDYGFGIAVNASGNVYTTGMFNGTGDFDPGSGTFNLNSDVGGHIFVQKMYCTDTTSSSMTQAACDSFTFLGETFTASGVYTKKLTGISGCDSVITLNLTINTITPAVITISAFTLSTTQPYSTYQWYRNNALITGANSSTYTVTQNGLYKVAVTSANGCTDTSAAYNVTNVTGIDDIRILANQIQVYPNPVNDVLYIHAPVKIKVNLTSIEGKIMMQRHNPSELVLSDLARGIYLLQVMDLDGNLIKVEKIIK